ncbi:MAG: c-type cytochrome [Saprospiraceae bacterium]|nr:c-type cytochrome [Saprospiraceae bacterium]
MIRHLLINYVFVVALIFTLCSCSDPTEDYLSEFIIDPNLEIKLVASEPHVILPVAMIEDAQHRWWVVEMPGYMRDIDGNDESVPDGRVVILSDTDQDGMIDQRTVFLDSLENPRALCFANNGLLFSDGKLLKWTAIENDEPQHTIVVDSFYVIGGNIEHQPNGLLYNLDNWIYSAKSNVRYRYKNGNWIKEATTFRGQWGISNDAIGRLIYNHNSAPLISDFTLPNQTIDHPFAKGKRATGRYLTDNMRIFPIQATSVNRGYQEGVLDATGKVINYTSACAPHVFYGEGLGENKPTSAFVAAPEGNLIARYEYEEEFPAARRTIEKREFLTSKEESFRPVNLITGFDGRLYIVDMRKGIIQHSAYMSSYLREKIRTKQLDKINGKGRIYAVQQKNYSAPTLNLNQLESAGLIELLYHPNLQIRLFAQKKLVEINDFKNVDKLLYMVSDSYGYFASTHALWTLEGMGELKSSDLIELGPSIQNPKILIHFIALSKQINPHSSIYKELYQKSIAYADRHLDFLVASSVGQNPEFDTIWMTLANRHIKDEAICESLINSIEGRENHFLNMLDIKTHNILINNILNILSNTKNKDIQTPKIVETPYDDDRTNGLKKFKTYCASCHGFDGKGQKNVAPSLQESAIIDGDEKTIARIILEGYSTEHSSYQIMMPAYIEDKNMTDQDIYDLISYLKSTYTSDWNSIQIDDIQALRKQLK